MNTETMKVRAIVSREPEVKPVKTGSNSVDFYVNVSVSVGLETKEEFRKWSPMVAAIASELIHEDDGSRCSASWEAEEEDEFWTLWFFYKIKGCVLWTPDNEELQDATIKAQYKPKLERLLCKIEYRKIVVWNPLTKQPVKIRFVMDEDGVEYE